MPCAHRTTNVEFLKDLMEHSAYGPLVQAFVLQGLQQYAKRVISSTPRVLDTLLVSGAA